MFGKVKRMTITNEQIKIRDLTKKYTEKVAEMERQKTEYEDSIRDLRRENMRLVKQSIRTSNLEKYKAVLRLYANGFGIGLIYKTLVEEEGEDITLDEIRSLVDRVDILDDELRHYYYACKKEFTDNVQVNKGFFASTIYKKYQLLENVLSEQLIKAQELDDEQTVLKCVAELKNIYKEMSATFFKNGFDNQQNTTVIEIKESYNENKTQKISSLRGVKIV
jgi:hypothetical protein